MWTERWSVLCQVSAHRRNFLKDHRMSRLKMIISVLGKKNLPQWLLLINWSSVNNLQSIVDEFGNLFDGNLFLYSAVIVWLVEDSSHSHFFSFFSSLDRSSLFCRDFLINEGGQQLKLLDLSGCSQINGDALPSLIEGCPRLKFDSIFCCDNLDLSSTGNLSNLNCCRNVDNTNGLFCCRKMYSA